MRRPFRLLRSASRMMSCSQGHPSTLIYFIIFYFYTHAVSQFCADHSRAGQLPAPSLLVGTLAPPKPHRKLPHLSFCSQRQVFITFFFGFGGRGTSGGACLCVWELFATVRCLHADSVASSQHTQAPDPPAHPPCASHPRWMVYFGTRLRWEAVAPPGGIASVSVSNFHIGEWEEQWRQSTKRTSGPELVPK